MDCGKPDVFSGRLKEALRIKNIKQVELCEMAGIPKSAMSQYISGAFEPKQDRLWALARALDVNEAWLMGYSVPMERDTKNSLELGYGNLQHTNSEAVALLEQDENDMAKNPDERKVLLLARHLEKIPEEKRARIIKNFEDTIDTYLDAMGLTKED